MNTKQIRSNDEVVAMAMITKRLIHRNGCNSHEYVVSDPAGNELFVIGVGGVFVGKEMYATDAPMHRLIEQSAKEQDLNTTAGTISFLSEQAALNNPPRAEELTRDEAEIPGYVRIHSKKTDWFVGLSTQKLIPNKFAEVVKYLNEKAPQPYTEQQLATIAIHEDRRRLSAGYTITLNISGDGPMEVAFLSGPIEDYPVTP